MHVLPERQPLENGRRYTVPLRLTDLADMHPCLLWDDIVSAAAAVTIGRAPDRPFRLSLQIEAVPGWGDGEVDLEIFRTGVKHGDVAKVQRTYEPHRLVELAAIAMAGLALFHVGGHQIRDVALRGSSADYQIDYEGHVMEVAGRSWRRDFGTAWSERWRRLSGREGSGFYLFVVEFETPSARLAFGRRTEDEYGADAGQ